MKSGQGVTQEAAAFGVIVDTLYRWLANYASGYQKALHPGRRPKLHEEHLRCLVAMVRNSTPLQRRFRFPLWSLGFVQAVLEHQFG